LYPGLNSSNISSKVSFPLKRNYSDVRIQSSLYSETDISVKDDTVRRSVIRTGVFYRETRRINGKVTGSVTKIEVTNQGFNYTKSQRLQSKAMD
jgi:hypothetical protein